MVSTVGDFCALLSCLGAPEISPSELEWAGDLPAGKELLKWMSMQMSNTCQTGDSGGSSSCDWARGVSLRTIALEDEEYQIFKGISRHDTDNIRGLSSSYTVPSVLIRRSRNMESEQEILEAEVKKLKYRLNQAKTACQTLKQTSKDLRLALKGIDADIDTERERSTELSCKADLSISRSVASACKILNLQESSTSQGAAESAPSESDPRRHVLAILSALRREIVSTAEEHTEHIVRLEASLPSVSEIQQRASRIHETLQETYLNIGGTNKNLPVKHALLDLSYRRELQAMCGKLKDDPSVLDDESGFDDIPGYSDGYDAEEFDVDVIKNVENAWKLDKQTILTAREDTIDWIQKSFDETLIPYLKQLHETLSSINAQQFEAEALISALLEEMEVTADDITGAKEAAQNLGSTSDELDDLLDAKLKIMLKDLRNSRPPDAPPLVLLDHADLVQELSQIEQRSHAVRSEEKAWASELLRSLSSLSEIHTSTLSTVYSNSPVNSSPPFNPPHDLAQLVLEARRQAEKMTSGIIRLQKDVGLSSRTTRKLNSFVEKWGEPRE